MKRSLLIAGGTVGGLGAVMAITPPQFGTTDSLGGLSGAQTIGSTSAATVEQTAAVATQPASTPVATKAAATKKATATKSAAVTKKTAAATTGASAAAQATQAASTPTASATPTPTPTAVKTTAAASTGGYSGTVTGASYNARGYGNLTATVTFKDGAITNVSAIQSPSSWSQRSLSALIPFVNGGKVTIEQIKKYSAAQLPCATSNSCRSQASFTAEAFWSSIKSAISKAGL